MKKSGLDLLLVNVGGTKKRVYQELGEDYSAIEPPFWAALTAGFLRRRGFEVGILDANAENLTYEETGREAEERIPGLVNIVVYGQHPSASTQLMTGVGQLCREIKKRNPNRKIILTGLHPSALPARTLKEEECDYVCEGEGFYTIQRLLEGANLKNIPGLWYREEGRTINTPRAKNIGNLTEEAGEVAWDLLPFEKKAYKAHNWQCMDDFSKRNLYASLSTSLGCPFKCDFCSIYKTFGERRIRFWNPDWVIRQIETLFREYDVRVFKIIDELFVLKPEHYLAIADGLARRGLGDKINMWAYARVDTLKQKHLKRLRRGGIKWLCIGFESGNEDILKQVHKGNFARQDMIDASREVQSSGIEIIANYMFGFPEDTQETMTETLEMAMEQNCAFANFYCASAWPGSPLYDRVAGSGIVLPEKWEDYAQHAYGFVPLSTKHLSSEDVLKFRDGAFNAYFTNPKYLSRIESRFGLQARKHIEKMTDVKLKRALLCH